MKAVNQALTKINNRNFVLKQIIRKPMPRIELAGITGLTKMTVSNIVNELIEDGYITEGSREIQDTPGRRPTVLMPDKDKYCILGIYLCRDNVTAFSANLNGDVGITAEEEFKDETAASVSEKILSAAKRITDSEKGIMGIGISSIGPIDFENGALIKPPYFFDIDCIEICRILREAFSLPVFIENDMNASALAEKYWGNAGELSNFIYLGAAKGIGAGIVMNGRLCGGDFGEIGHVTVDMNGRKCQCGNRGCLEMYASISNSAKENDKEQICRYLAEGCITLMNLFNPQKIFLGHRIPLLGNDAADIISAYTQNRCIMSRHKRIDIEFSKFRDKAPFYGAAAIFIDKYIF